MSVDPAAPTAEDPAVGAPDERAPAARVPRSDSRVLAVLVVHDGAPWLPRTLAALERQTHADLDVVAVDNGSTDGSRALLTAHLGEDRVLVADRDLGYGAAVSMALDARAADEAPYVLCLHDDLDLDEHAVAALAEALDDDPRLAVVGAKLRDWDDPRRLQSVGWTVDLTGRADSGVDEGELDQGQRDVDRRTLYVSTSGMLLRREVFDELGRFDRRYHLFRDDLDLCWRAWIAGHDVEVVPAATGEHAAAAATYQRLGQTRFIGPRYFAERNTLATLLKNYGVGRLALVIPAFFLVGIAKVLGFLLTRRFSDAWQTVRAWAWNVVHLPETLRLRRAVQALRRRRDAELRELFGRIAPRLRAYVEAIGEWIAGGEYAETAAPAESDAEPATFRAKVVGFVRTRPVLVTGGLLGVLLLVGFAPVLAPGELRGGDIAPWPATPAAFLADHAAAWHATAGLGTDAAPSPAQALLGALQWLVGGSAYLAPRVLLLGAPLLAWLLALRAAQRYSPRKLPRVAAASAYVLSPPALTALATGRLDGIVALVALPGLVAAAGTYTRSATPPARGWRAAAGAALLGAVLGSFVPAALPLLAVAALVVVAVGAPRAAGSWRAPFAGRVLLAGLGPWALTAPWSLRLLAADGPIRGAVAGDVASSPLWRWVLLVPDLPGGPDTIAGVGFLAAAVLGVLFGWRRQAPLVLGLWALLLASAAYGWWQGATGTASWPGLPSLIGAAACAGLLAVAFARGQRTLGAHDFGWRQLAAGATVVAVVVSLGAVATQLVTSVDEAYVRDRPALPTFITAAAAAAPDDPFLVLVLAEIDGEVRAEVVPGAGPTAAATGVPDDPASSVRIGRAVADLVTGRDVRVGTTLGGLGVRFLVVPDGAVGPQLDAGLRRQVGLEPRPVAAGRVLAVTDALPAAALLPPSDAASLRLTGALPGDAEPTPLPVDVGGRVTTRVDEASVLVLARPDAAPWVVEADGEPLAAEPGPVPTYDVPADVVLTVSHRGDGLRSAALALQGLLVLLVVSLGLRPPGIARRRVVAEPDATRPLDPRGAAEAPTEAVQDAADGTQPEVAP